MLYCGFPWEFVCFREISPKELRSPMAVRTTEKNFKNFVVSEKLY